MDQLGTALNGVRIQAADGLVGEIVDVFVDERTWHVEWIVACSGAWLNFSRVLIHPMLIERPDFVNGRCQLTITRDQIRNSPGLDENEVVSPSLERNLEAYYGLASPVASREPHAVKRPQEHRLHSLASMLGYDILTPDGTAGFLRDYVLDDESWRIRGLVIDIPKFWFGTPVVLTCLPPAQISEEDCRMFMDRTCAELQASAPLNRPGPIDLVYRALRHKYRIRKAERLSHCCQVL